MEEKKSKVNLILSIVSFSITALLLVMVSMAWYATNKTAYVNGGIGHTAGTDYDLSLQRGEYDSDHSTWTWTNTNDLSITNLQPGDSYFFRFKIEYGSQVKFETSFTNIASSLVENSLIATVGTKTYVQINGTGQNWLEATGNVVSIVEVDNGTPQSPKQLYSIAGGVVTLNTTAYRVADTFKLYDYGLGTIDFGNDATISDSDLKENGGAVSSAILTSNPTMLYDLTTLGSASGDAYGYFALEFNDALSIKNYIHLDGTTSSDSNLYQCQSLTIGAIGLRDITEG